MLYQVIFHADIAAHDPERPFTIDDVAARMTAKMIGRHPHVFADATAETAADVVAVWDDLKAAEKPGRTSVLDGIPERMPPLQLADKLLSRAERLGWSAPARRRSRRPQRTSPSPRTRSASAFSRSCSGQGRGPRLRACAPPGDPRSHRQHPGGRVAGTDDGRPNKVNALPANQEGVTQALAPIDNAGVPGVENDASALVAVRMKLPEINPTRGESRQPECLMDNTIYA